MIVDAYSHHSRNTSWGRPTRPVASGGCLSCSLEELGINQRLGNPGTKMNQREVYSWESHQSKWMGFFKPFEDQKVSISAPKLRFTIQKLNKLDSHGWPLTEIVKMMLDAGLQHRFCETSSESIGMLRHIFGASMWGFCGTWMPSANYPPSIKFLAARQTLNHNVDVD